MPRARNIKPAFFTDEDVVELPFVTRLLFIGLWTLADREGRLDDKPKQVKMHIFPADDVDVDAELQRLADAKFIVRYVVKNERFIQIVNFSKHQNPHSKETASTRPAPGKPRARTGRGVLIPDSLDLIPDSPISDSGEASPKGKKKETATPLPDDFEITDRMREWFETHCPTIEIEVETEAFKNRAIAKGYEYKDWQAGWRTQMMNAEKWARERGDKPRQKNNSYDPTTDPLSAEYIMPNERLTFDVVASMFFNGPHNDGTKEKYEGMKSNWLSTIGKGYEGEVEAYERTARFRERFSQAG